MDVPVKVACNAEKVVTVGATEVYVTVPVRAWPPAINVTMPVGAAPKPAVFTVAVMLKVAFACTVLGLEVIAVDVAACVMVKGTAAEMLAL
jgi:hypothetical protein